MSYNYKKIRETEKAILLTVEDYETSLIIRIVFLVPGFLKSMN